MQDWNSLRPEDRILRWREFRLTLDSDKLSNKDIVRKVAQFWANAPRGARSLDFYNPDTWPTPWEILNYNLFCENTISLMMFYTLDLLDSFDQEIQIYHIDDIVGEYIVPVVENKYVLNVAYGDVISIDDELKIVNIYPKKQIKNIN
jgi:hypothetical protein